MSLQSPIRLGQASSRARAAVAGARRRVCCCFRPATGCALGCAAGRRWSLGAILCALCRHILGLGANRTRNFFVRPALCAPLGARASSTVRGAQRRPPRLASSADGTAERPHMNFCSSSSPVCSPVHWLAR